MKPSPELHISITGAHDAVLPVGAQPLPTSAQITAWIAAVFTSSRAHYTQVNIDIALLTLSEMAALNHYHRGKNTPTNVLSFPHAAVGETHAVLYGDIAFCPAVMLAESVPVLSEKTAPLFHDHFAHLAVHATLHLLGYTHDCEKHAQVMEEEEVCILQTLGIPNPYQVQYNAST